jgi:hypothetical protein
MKQHQPALSRLSGPMKSKKREKKKKTFPSLTSRFLIKIVSSNNKVKQHYLLLHPLPHAHPSTNSIVTK